MLSPVALIVIGIHIAFALDQFFDVPWRIAVVIGLLPLAFAKGLRSPYGSRARDTLHDSRDPDQRE